MKSNKKLFEWLKAAVIVALFGVAILYFPSPEPQGLPSDIQTATTPHKPMEKAPVKSEEIDESVSS